MVFLTGLCVFLGVTMSRNALYQCLHKKLSRIFMMKMFPNHMPLIMIIIFIFLNNPFIQVCLRISHLYRVQWTYWQYTRIKDALATLNIKQTTTGPHDLLAWNFCDHFQDNFQWKLWCYKIRCWNIKVSCVVTLDHHSHVAPHGPLYISNICNALIHCCNIWLLYMALIALILGCCTHYDKWVTI